MDFGGREGAADVAECLPLLSDDDLGPVEDLSSPSSHRPRQGPPCAPDLGAPPSYLEVGLWKDRLPASGGGAALKLNPTLRADGDEVLLFDPITGAESLFSVGKPMQEALARIAAEPAQIDRLPDPLRERLTALGVLVDESAVPAAKAEWERAVQQAATSFRTRGHAELPSFHCPALIAFLRQRYRRMAREAALAYGDPQCPTRWTAHNEEAALPLHSALVPVVSAIVGRRVRPSYLYLGVYAEGSELPRHTDREQCELTLSLLIDYLPDVHGPSPWPLQLYVGEEPLSIYQHLGQSLLFAGREIPHSRPPLPAGHMSSSIFFHFVSEDFRGSID
jgi:hypothetical protein